jgi:hypothetical protein
MTLPEEVTINETEYYNAKDLKEYDPAYFHGCATTVRKIIVKKNINNENYIYASYNKKKGWTTYDYNGKISNRAQLMLKKDWCESNIPKMSKTEDIEHAPPILELNETFKDIDIDDNVIEIETRDICDDVNHCYFYAKNTILNTHHQYWS